MDLLQFRAQFSDAAVDQYPDVALPEAQHPGDLSIRKPAAEFQTQDLTLSRRELANSKKQGILFLAGDQVRFGAFVR
jgi:hypothetical protein